MKKGRQEPLVVEPAREDEWGAVIRLIFRYLDSQERETRLTNALEMIRRKELDPAGIIAARTGANELRGALLCQPMPGASGIIWPPQTIPKNHRHTEDQLMYYSCCWLASEGAKLVQSLLRPEEAGLARPLEGNGFAKITRLRYLRHDLKLPAGFFQEERLVYQCYDSCEPELFHQTLLRTYEQTLDCPEVSGIRTLEEIIAGHKSQGIHDPGHWWLAWHQAQAVGVLLVAEMADGKGWDILYVGVAPEARRRGFGLELTRKALREAKAAEAPQLTLAVDARNRPAWNLYKKLGFEAFDEREVYLKRLQTAEGDEKDAANLR